jgi:predicted permease
VLHDLRFALRLLAKTPGFAAAVVGSLAVGIALNAALFTVVNALLLRPLPYERSEELVEVSHPRRTLPLDELRAAGAFRGVAAYTPWNFAVPDAEGASLVYGCRTSASMFTMLGVRPALGRNFAPHDENQPVVMLGYEYWRRTSGDPKVIGKTLSLDGQPRTVIGVLPADFTLFVRDANLWIPQRMTQGRTLGRLRPGVTPEQAAAEVAAILSRLPAEAQTADPRRRTQVTPLAVAFRPNDAPAVLLWQAAVGLVLLITCANVANLLLVRAAARRREFAIRAAIGAQRWRVARQLAAESALLAVAGAVLGLLLAHWSLDFLRAQLPVNLARILRGADGLSIDIRVLVFVAAASLLTALLFGLAPMVNALRVDVMSCLRDAGRGATGDRQRFGALLVAGEIALAVVLVTGAGLLGKSLLGLERQNLGFSADHVLRAYLELPRSSAEQRAAAFAAALRSLEAVPGVEATGALAPQFFPFGGPQVRGAVFEIQGRPELQPRAETYVASPHYFRTVHIPLLRGRFFTDADQAGSPPVAVIGNLVASRYWPTSDPIGHAVRLDGADSPWVTIVGVVGDTRNPVGRDWQPTVYRPWAQAPAAGGGIYVRTAGDPMALAPQVRHVLRGVSAAPEFLARMRIASLEQAVAEYINPQRFTTRLLGAFAGLGLLLAAFGVYGVTRYWVSARIPEIGVRLALGARPADVMRLVLGRAAGAAVFGVAAGLGGALALQKVIVSQLYGVSPTDPAVLAAVSVLVTLAALAAAFWPARRAARTDPLAALRHE